MDDLRAFLKVDMMVGKKVDVMDKMMVEMKAVMMVV